MSKEIDTEKWLASLFSELIRRGMESHEHIYFKDFPLSGLPAPNFEQLKNAHLGWVGEFVTPLLKDHFDRIISDYQKREGQP